MDINGETFTVGADPEIFVGINGKFTSAHNMIPGDKINPHKVNNGAVQVDGMALEFNIDPAKDFNEFKQNLESVQNQLLEMIQPVGAEFIKDVSVMFDEDFLKDIPIMNVLLGCESDFNGWIMDVNDPPNQQALMRTVGGHIHLGGFFAEDPFMPHQFNKAGLMARILDEELGVYSILWDKDDKRRSMYGRAGTFRPKTYGMEYRTMSNAWIFSDKLIKFVYDSAERAVNRFVSGDHEVNPEVEEIINSSDRNNKFFVNNSRVDELGLV